MSYTKAIRKGYVCMFHTGCSGCAMKNLCVSAGSLHTNPREYLLRNRGYRMPKNESMQRGILKHELYQQGMRDAKIIPFHVLRRDMYSGREIIVKECHVCSPFYGLRGVIDVLKFQYDKEKKIMNVYSEEIKSSYWQPYILQMAVYGLILSDLNFQIIQEVTKRKTRRVPFTFYPKDRFSLNLKVNLQIFAKKPYEIEWMKNNVMTKLGDGISCSVLQKAKKLRKYHKLGINWLSELPRCEYCNPEQCGFYSRFCSKLPELNPDSPTKQMYWGKNFDNRMLIKTKPKLNLAELDNMVKIK